MFAALTALVLAAISHVALATPLGGTGTGTPTQPTTPFGVTIAASFPIRTLDIIRNGTHGGTTGTRDGIIRQRAAEANPAELLLCPNTNCASCSGFALNSLPEDECFLTNVDAFSVAISQPLGGGLPFVVDVGTPGCASLATIPAINECFNVNGGPFTNFALLP